MKLSLHPSHPARRTQDSLIHRMASDPYLDWLMMVVISVVLAGIMIGIGFMTYSGMRERLDAPTEAGTIIVRTIFDVSSLGKVLGSFAARSDEQARLLRGYSGVADPSL